MKMAPDIKIDYRDSARMLTKMPIIYCIDGNIGAGKSTLLKELENRGYFVFQEELSDWGELLDRFYSDEKRWMCSLQTAILHSMHQQYLQIQTLSHDVVFVERSPQSSMIFVKNGVRQGFMDAEETRIVENLYELLKWSPYMSFYVNTPVDLCYERVKNRNRRCENQISVEYLTFLHDEYSRTYSRCDHLMLNGTLDTRTLANIVIGEIRSKKV